MTDTTNDKKEKRNVTRSPGYPSIPLQEAIDDAEKLWHEEERHSFPIESIQAHWNLKSAGATIHRRVSALGKYGLLESSGKGSAKSYKLTDSALAIILESDDSDNREKKIKEAALLPAIYREIWSHYGGTLPSDTTLRTYLLLEKSFNKGVVDSFIEGFKATVEFAELKSTDNFVDSNDDLDSNEEEKENENPPLAAKPGETKRNNTQLNTPPDKVIGTYNTMLGESDVTLTFVGNQLVPEDLEALTDYVEFLRKSLERRIAAEERKHQFPADAVWKNNDHDQPVTIVGVMGRDEATGDVYFKSSDGTGIPRSELSFK